MPTFRLAATTATLALLLFAVPPAHGGAALDGEREISPDTANLSDADAGPDSDLLRAGGECPNVCSRSTRTILRSCGHEVQEDFLETIARCLHLEDDDEREECIELAREERDEAWDLCREQFHARKDVCQLLGQDPYDPEIEPEDFYSTKEAAEHPNPYFPLVPGFRWVYEAGDEVIEVTVTEETKEILGVECFVVKDVVKESGVVIEDTDDWYAVDRDGNVWYFGELTLEYEDGVLEGIEGSWEAGVDYAKAGIIMLADPEEGDAYRQEFQLGEVEDLGEVLSITGSEKVPVASCDGDCVITRDFTPIEPGRDTNKYYAPDIGLILEISASGDREELIEFDGERAGRSTGGTAFSHVNLETRISPNPFRAETNIRFEIERDARVAADVYDAAGRRVRSLADATFAAGGHALRWDGTDTAGQRAATGVYFVRMKVDDREMTMKLVLAR